MISRRSIFALLGATASVSFIAGCGKKLGKGIFGERSYVVGELPPIEIPGMPELSRLHREKAIAGLAQKAKQLGAVADLSQATGAADVNSRANCERLMRERGETEIPTGFRDYAWMRVTLYIKGREYHYLSRTYLDGSPYPGQEKNDKNDTGLAVERGANGLIPAALVAI